MAEELAKTLASCKKDQAKNLHELEILRIQLFLRRQENQAAIAEAEHQNDTARLATLRLTERTILPFMQQGVTRMEKIAERWKARVTQIAALLAWEIKEDEELQPIQEPVYFV